MAKYLNLQKFDDYAKNQDKPAQEITEDGAPAAGAPATVASVPGMGAPVLASRGVTGSGDVANPVGPKKKKKKRVQSFHDYNPKPRKVEESVNEDWKVDLSDYIKSDARHLENKDNLEKSDIDSLIHAFKEKYEPGVNDDDLFNQAANILGYKPEDVEESVSVSKYPKKLITEFDEWDSFKKLVLGKKDEEMVDKMLSDYFKTESKLAHSIKMMPVNNKTEPILQKLKEHAQKVNKLTDGDITKLLTADEKKYLRQMMN